MQGAEAVFNVSTQLISGQVAQQMLLSHFQPAFESYTGALPTQLTVAAASHVPLYPTNDVLTRYFKMWPTEGDFLKGVFQARPTGSMGPNLFSGTIFKTVYNGKEEIYGVTAAHAIADHIGDPSLHRFFTADIYMDGKFLSVPAEIVQVSAPSTLDLALVKFPAETEAWFTPFDISMAEPAQGDDLQTQGFSINHVLYLPARSVLSKNLFYLRTEMELSPNQRRGLCGSPVVNKERKLVGVHIGSAPGKVREPSFVGYATQADFLRSLVQAYHRNGKASIPFVLAGKKVAELNVDEYVAYVRLLESDGSVMWYKMLLSKFPYREVEEIIKSFSPRYLEIAVGRVSWDGKLLTEEHGLIPADATWYRYDFRTGQTGKIK